MNGRSMLAKSFAFALAVLIAAGSNARAAGGQAADDIAHFFAGLPPSAEAPLAALTGEAEWKRHAAFLDSRWKELEDRQLSRVRVWSAENVKQSQPVLYYMFSGPDFLYANAFFPNAKTIIMSGLEPSGAVPELS